MLRKKVLLTKFLYAQKTIQIYTMDILFYPRLNDSVNKAGRCSIYCVITVNQNQCVPFSTKIRINAKNWLSKKKTTSDEFADTIRQELNRTENTLRKIKIELENDNLPITAEIIKHEYFKKQTEQSQKKTKLTQKNDLAEIFEIITSKKMSKGAKPSTNRHDKYLAKSFLDFAKQQGFKNIEPKQITLDFVELYIQNFKNSNNYLNQSVRLLSKVLNYAVRQKMIAYNPIKEIELPPSQKKVTEIGLELEEIEILKAAIPQNEAEQKAIDIFLFMCGTGVDFCDYNRLTTENLSDIGTKKILRIERQKSLRYDSPTTCTQNAIIKQVALDILAKYKTIENLPKFKYAHLLDAVLQKVAERERIKSHLTTKRARKTFANLSINYEMHTDEQTAYQMGHKNTNQLKNYRKYSDKILSNLLE